MSLYLNYPINLESKPTHIAWSNTEIPILAVVTNNKKINFYLDEACNIKEKNIVKDKLITTIVWHPNTMVLSYGLEDGTIGIWIDSDNYNQDNNSFHESKITNIKFNNNGNRLISVDANNYIAVWFFEGSLTKLCTYSQKHSIENILFPAFNIKRYIE